MQIFEVLHKENPEVKDLKEFSFEKQPVFRWKELENMENSKEKQLLELENQAKKMISLRNSMKMSFKSEKSLESSLKTVKKTVKKTMKNSKKLLKKIKKLLKKAKALCGKDLKNCEVFSGSGGDKFLSELMV